MHGATQMDRIEWKLDHVLEAAHEILTALSRAGGMTPDDVAAMTQRLARHAARLEGIAKGATANATTATTPAEGATQHATTDRPSEATTMATPQNLQDVLTKIDTDTTAVAGAVTSLIAKINTGMTQADVDLVTGKLTEIATRLEQTATNASNPVPPGPPPTPVGP